MSISPRSGARGFRRLPFLKYYNVLDWNLHKYRLYQKLLKQKMYVHTTNNHWSSKKIFLGTKDLSSELCKIHISFIIFNKTAVRLQKRRFQSGTKAK